MTVCLLKIHNTKGFLQIKPAASYQKGYSNNNVRVLTPFIHLDKYQQFYTFNKANKDILC